MVILGLLLLAGSLGGAWAYQQQNPPPPPSAKEPEPAPPLVMAIGYVDGEFGVAKLFPLASGRVTSTAAEGAPVAKGDAVLVLDDQLAQMKLKEAEADLANAAAQLEQAKKLEPQHAEKIKQQISAIAGADLKKKAMKNELDAKEKSASEFVKLNTQLLDAMRQTVAALDKVIEVEQSKLAELKLVDAKLEVKRADANVAAKTVQRDQAQYALDQMKVLAPSDGTVLRVHVNPGEILGPGAQRPAIEFLPKGSLIVRAEILQEWAPRVKLDQEVEIVDDTYQGPSWKGKVYFTAPWFTQKRNLIIEPFMYNDVRYMECLVRVAESPSPPRVGQRVRVRIQTTEPAKQPTR